MPEVPEHHKKLNAEFKTLYEPLVRKVHEKGLFVTGFIYGETETNNPDSPDIYMLRFGNIRASSPQEMFYIHQQLAMMAANLELSGQVNAEGIEKAASAGSEPTGPNPLEVADILALAVMTMPSDMLPAQVTEILARYLEVRRPEDKNGRPDKV